MVAPSTFALTMPPPWQLLLVGLVALVLVGVATLSVARLHHPHQSSATGSANADIGNLPDYSAMEGSVMAPTPIVEHTTDAASSMGGANTARLVVPSEDVNDEAVAPSAAALRIFISHSTLDNEIGLRLAADLRAALEVDEDAIWYDAAGGLQGGDAWLQRIVSELSTRPIFLILLSRAAVSSKWVLDERNLAWLQKNSATGKVIIPVLLEPCEVPAELSLLQFVSFVPPRPYDEALAELLRAIRSSGLRAEQLARGSHAPLGLPFEEDLLLVPAFFVGRQEDLAWLETRLGAGGATAITALEGLGGIGKTALAAMAIRHLRRAGAFPDGIAVVLCHNLTDPAEVLARVLTRFDPNRKAPQETTLVDLARRAHYMLMNKQALVVLDNVEPALPVGEVVTPLREAGLTVLLTARQTLPTDVVPTDAGRILDLLSPEEALELFAWALGREHADALSPAEHGASSRIVAALGRHTLAVRLAGAYAAGVGRDLVVLAGELERDPLVVPGETPRGVALILSRSTAILSDGGRQLFAALAAFATPECGRQAALALAHGLGQVDSLASVDLLVRRALAEAYISEDLPEGADRERLRLHPLVRAFAEGLFARWTEDDRHAASLAVARHYSVYAEASHMLYPALAADEGNLMGALEWAQVHGQWELVANLAHGLRNFWFVRGRVQEGVRFLAWGVAAIQTSLSVDESRSARRQMADMNLVYGQLLVYNGQPEPAAVALQRSLDDYRRALDRRGEGAAIAALGEAALFRGQNEDAAAYLQQSLVIHREEGDLPGWSQDLEVLGDVELARGQFGAAEDYLRQSLAIRRQTGNRQGEGETLCLLGQAALARGQIEAAESFAQQALVIAREVGDRQNEAIELGMLGQMARRQGQYEMAEGYLHQALTIVREVGFRQGEGQALSSLGRLALEHSKVEAAESYLQQSLAIRREIGDREGEGVDLDLLGQVMLARGQIEAGESRFQQALVLAREVGNERSEAQELRSLGRVAEAQDNLAEAESSYRRSLALSLERDMGPDIAEAQLVLGYLLADRLSRRDEGCPLVVEAARRFAEMGMPQAADAQAAAERLGCPVEAPDR